MSAHVPLHPQELLRRVAEAHFCTMRDVLGPSRQKEPASARALLYLLLHQECRWSCELIAARLHRDPSTVRAGIAQAQRRLHAPDGAALYRWVLSQEPEQEAQSEYGAKQTEGKEPASHNERIPLSHGERAAGR